MYWVRPERILSAKPGMHRFVWDLHYTKPNSLSHEFPISAIVHNTPELPLGAIALPGNYTVNLRVGGSGAGNSDGYTQPLVVKMDPRIKSSGADLAQQFAMESASVIGMNDTFAALSQLQSVRGQIKERMAQAGKSPLADSLAALDQRLAQLEGTAESNFAGLPPSGKQPENFATAHQHFAAMLRVADSYDGAPTTQAIATFKLLEDDTQQLFNTWKNVKEKDLANVNADLAKSGQPPIDANKPPSAAPSSDDDGDDEP
jgi:hypothetical protein